MRALWLAWRFVQAILAVATAALGSGPLWRLEKTLTLFEQVSACVCVHLVYCIADGWSLLRCRPFFEPTASPINSSMSLMRLERRLLLALVCYLPCKHKPLLSLLPPLPRKS